MFLIFIKNSTRFIKCQLHLLTYLKGDKMSNLENQRFSIFAISKTRNVK